MTDRELIDLARAASKYAYAPYSKFSVGAALECADGTVYTGCNVENAVLSCTICAERCAALKAVSSGEKRFVKIAIFADSPDYCVPCGTCRQVLSEFSPSMEVLCVRSDGRYVSYKLKDLLPFMFSNSFLK